MTISTESKKLKIGQKLSIGMGEISAVSTRQVISMFLLFYLTDVVGISAALAGTVFLVGRTWEALCGPIIGIWSDETRTKWGRRRPFFLFSALPMSFFFFLLFCPFSGINAIVYYSLMYVLYVTALNSFSIPYRSFIAEVTDDYSERHSIVNYRQFFSMFFGLVAAVVPKMIADAYGNPQLGWKMMAAYVGVFAMIFPFLLFKNTKERKELYNDQERIKGLKDISIVFRNKFFIQLLLIYVGVLAATNLLESFIVYYLKYSVNRYNMMEVIFVVFILCGILSFPIWSKLTKKIGKRNSIILGASLFAVYNLFWLFMDKNTPTIMIIILGALVGSTYGCTQVIPTSMIPDVVDIDELERGYRREGLYQGVLGLCMKIVNSLSVFFVGLILQYSGYIADAVQSLQVLRAIKSIMTFAPIILVIPAIISAVKYPLTKAKHKEVMEKLEARRKKN